MCGPRTAMRVVFRCDPVLEPYLPRPVAARDALPPWLANMPRHALSDAHGTEIRTVKHCPPFIDAMALGFIMTLPCDVRVDGGALSWEWEIPRPAAGAHPRSPISFHAPAQVEGTPLHLADRAIVKFNSFWTIALEPGWSLLATHPLNQPDLAVHDAQRPGRRRPLPRRRHPVSRGLAGTRFHRRTRAWNAGCTVLSGSARAGRTRLRGARRVRRCAIRRDRRRAARGGGRLPQALSRPKVTRGRPARRGVARDRAIADRPGRRPSPGRSGRTTGDASCSMQRRHPAPHPDLATPAKRFRG